MIITIIRTCDTCDIYPPTRCQHGMKLITMAKLTYLPGYCQRGEEGAHRYHNSQ